MTTAPGQASGDEAHERLLHTQATQWADEAAGIAATIQHHHHNGNTAALRELTTTLTRRQAYALITIYAVLTKDTDFHDRPQAPPPPEAEG